MDTSRGTAMQTSLKAWTVAATLITTLAATGSVLWGQSGRPEPQAFMVKDIDGTFDTSADSSPGRFVEARGAILFAATYGLWRTDGTPAGTALIKPLDVSGLQKVND